MMINPACHLGSHLSLAGRRGDGWLRRGLVVLSFLAVTSMLPASSIVLLGHTPSGSLYQVSAAIGQNEVTGWQVAVWNYGTSDYVVKFVDKQIGTYGGGTNPTPETFNGTYTVPVGVSNYSFLTGRVIGGSWQYEWHDFPIGQAGTYDPDAPESVTEEVWFMVVAFATLGVICFGAGYGPRKVIRMFETTSTLIDR